MSSQEKAAQFVCDQHYIHEVTSPQLFQGLRDAGAIETGPTYIRTFDHNVTVSTHDIEMSFLKAQIDKLAEKC